MIPSSRPLYDLFSPANILSIPDYQRTYEWTLEQWHNLIRDILDGCTSPQPIPHWMGIILLDKANIVNEKNSTKTHHYIIDGQQRLVTLRVWISALVHHSETVGKPLTNLDIANFRVQKSDAESFKIAVDGNWENHSKENLNHGVLSAYNYFRWVLWLGELAILSEIPITPPKYTSRNSSHNIEQILESELTRKSKDPKLSQLYSRSNQPNLEQLFKATWEKLTFTQLVLEANDEEPSRIFAILNSKRLELEPFDNVRNRVFMLLQESLKDNNKVSEIFEEFWQPAEQNLRAHPQKRISSVNSFLYDFLISKGEKKNQNLSVKNASFNFERFLQSIKTPGFSLENFLVDEFLPSMEMWLIAKGKKDRLVTRKHSFSLSQPTMQLIQSINELSEGPPVPLILLFLNQYRLAKVTESDLQSALFLIEGLLIRMILADKGYSANRAKFMEICSKLNLEIDLKSLKTLIANDAPSDEDILNLDFNDPIYERWGEKLGPLFRGIERALSGEHSNWVKFGKNGFSVEHIIPQDYTKWEKDFILWGTNLSNIKKVIHSLGNLTIISSSQNSSIRNSIFSKKIEAFKNSGTGAPLKLDHNWVKLNQFSEKEIIDRTTYLRRVAIDYWKLE